MDEPIYQAYQKRMDKEFESICRRCGRCCGSEDDPCANLAKNSDGVTYYCRAYDDRIGPQKTVAGNYFNCCTIRDNIRMGVIRPECAYNSNIKNIY